MAIVWPPSVNDLIHGSDVFTLADGRIRSSTDIGPGKVRNRSSSGAGKFQAVFALDWDQRDDLERFFLADTAGGVLPFEFKYKGRVLLVRFSEETLSFQPTQAHGRFTCQVELDVLP